MQEYLDRYMRALKDDERENTFAIHLLFIEASMTNWQPYMEYLTKETREGVSILPGAAMGASLTKLYRQTGLSLPTTITTTSRPFF
jgi:hypothetical protein